MFRICVQVRRSIIIVLVIVPLLTLPLVSAAPRLHVTTSCKSQEQNDSGVLSYMTSKALGAFVRAASYICQWLPQLPEWMRPPKPTLRVVQPTDVCAVDDDYSLDELDFLSAPSDRVKRKYKSCWWKEIEETPFANAVIQRKPPMLNKTIFIVTLSIIMAT